MDHPNLHRRAHEPDPADTPAVRDLHARLAAVERASMTHVQGGGHLRPLLDLSRDHVRGPAAEVTLLEYGDYTCPHTRQLAGVLDVVLGEMGDRVRFAWRHFPLETGHRDAAVAALALEAAARQGGFWALHDRLVHAEPRPPEHWVRMEAEGAGLDVPRLLADVREGAGADRILADVDSGAASGVNGTPTLFVAGRRHDGELDADGLRAALEAVTSSPPGARGGG